MRPEAPPYPSMLAPDEQTQPGTPTAKLLDEALERFARDKLPGILQQSEARITRGTAAAAAAAVINALGERLYTLESDVRALNESAKDSGMWRMDIERRLHALEARNHHPTEPSPPPSEGP